MESNSVGIRRGSKPESSGSSGGREAREMRESRGCEPLPSLVSRGTLKGEENGLAGGIGLVEGIGLVGGIGLVDVRIASTD